MLAPMLRDQAAQLPQRAQAGQSAPEEDLEQVRGVHICSPFRRFSGHSFERRICHRVTATLMLEADKVLLAEGRFLRDAPNAPAGRWAKYLSLNALANF